MVDVATYYLCARVSKGEAEGVEYVEWAVERLLQGNETPSIGILSSFMEPLFKPELEEYFYKSLTELGWRFPLFEESAINCISFLANKITDGSFEPVKTTHEIYTYVRDLGYPSELIVWLEIDDLIDEKKYCKSSQISDEELIKKIYEEARKIV